MTLKTCLSEVLCALEDLYKHGFCHRGVRWANILKNIDQTWMLIDFDFAAKLKRGTTEWPPWTRGVPEREGNEKWSARHDIKQVNAFTRSLAVVVSKKRGAHGKA